MPSIPLSINAISIWYIFDLYILLPLALSVPGLRIFFRIATHNVSSSLMRGCALLIFLSLLVLIIGYMRLEGPHCIIKLASLKTVRIDIGTIHEVLKKDLDDSKCGVQHNDEESNVSGDYQRAIPEMRKHIRNRKSITNGHSRLVPSPEELGKLTLSFTLHCTGPAALESILKFPSIKILSLTGTVVKPEFSSGICQLQAQRPQFPISDIDIKRYCTELVAMQKRISYQSPFEIHSKGSKFLSLTELSAVDKVMASDKSLTGGSTPGDEFEHLRAELLKLSCASSANNNRRALYKAVFHKLRTSQFFETI